MQITKYEHSSLKITHNDTTFLFDPGAFSVDTAAFAGVDVLLITHSHGDHLHIPHVQLVREANPELIIVTNSEVAAILQAEGIEASVLEGEASMEIADTTITAHDNPHEEIYKDFGQVQNTGYYLDDVFFHPGDSFTTPNRATKAIATVIFAPFMRAKTAVEYINNNPDALHIGVHEQVASEGGAGFVKNIIESNKAAGIRYAQLGVGEVVEV